VVSADMPSTSASADEPSTATSDLAMLLTSPQMLSNMIGAATTPGITDLEKEINVILDNWKQCQDRLKTFVVEICDELQSAKVQQTALYQAAHALMSSRKYTNISKTLFAAEELSAAMTMLSSDIVMYVRDGLLKRHPAITTALISETMEIPPSAYGKIRHVGGMCIAKEMYAFRQRMHQIMNSFNCDLDTATKMKQYIELLQQLTDSESSLREHSTYQESLIETSRRQNVSRSLTNISDNAFEFFVSLEKVRLPLFTSGNVVLQQEMVLNTIRDNILNNSTLFQEWAKLFCVPETQTGNEISDIMNDLVDTCDNVVSLFEVVIKRYLNTCNSQYRQKLQSELQNKKDLAHRKKILARQEKARLLTMNDLDVSSDEARRVTHLKLQAEILREQQALTKLTIPALKTILKWYKLKARSNINKTDLIKILKENILVTDSLPE
jgi:hypothetical protein